MAAHTSPSVREVKISKVTTIVLTPDPSIFYFGKSECSSSETRLNENEFLTEPTGECFTFHRIIILAVDAV